MEKIEEFKIETSAIEEWLEGFEARAEALGIVNDGKKVRWCRAVIGQVGRSVLRGLDGANATYDAIKAELIRYFGEEDSKAAAWRKLKQYNAGQKGIGEIAADVLSFARAAATENDVRERLAIDAFLSALPWEVARELKKKKVDTLKKALEKAKTISALLEEDRKKAGGSHALQDSGHTPGAPRGAKEGPRWEAPRYSQGRGNTRVKGPREVVCWACRERGHIVRNCPVWQQWRQSGRPGGYRQQGSGHHYNIQDESPGDRVPENIENTREETHRLNW